MYVQRVEEKTRGYGNQKRERVKKIDSQHPVGSDMVG